MRSLFQDAGQIAFHLALIGIGQRLLDETLPGLRLIGAAPQLEFKQFQHWLRHAVSSTQPAIDRGIAVSAARVQRFAQKPRDIPALQAVVKHQMLKS